MSWVSSCTNLRRSSGDSDTSLRLRMRSSAVRTSAVSCWALRLAILGATSARTMSCTLRLDSSHVADCADGTRAAGFRGRRASSKRAAGASATCCFSTAASFSDSFMVGSVSGGAEEGGGQTGEEAAAHLLLALRRGGLVVLGKQADHAPGHADADGRLGSR